MRLTRTLIIFGVLLFTSCSFAYQKHVTGQYYIIGVDSKDDLTLSYYLNDGNFIGKAPPRLIEYGYDDTFLVAKVLEYGNSYPTYYIIDMTKDSDNALEETFRVGPISETEYNSTWKLKLNIKMNSVE
jgi:hypothetical protein